MSERSKMHFSLHEETELEGARNLQEQDSYSPSPNDPLPKETPPDPPDGVKSKEERWNVF